MRLLPPVSAAATAFKSALPRITHSHPPLPNPPRRRRHTRLSSMADGQVAGGGGDVVGLKPAVEKMRRLLSRDPLGGWQKCWEEAVTPWDLGQPTPILLHLVQTGSIPAGRILVPGCGSGYDVIALAGPERYAIGLDVSDTALSRAIELSSRSPTGKHCAFLKEDFFDWNSTELFDVIFDYTFFCAIDPNMRPAWARRMNELLKSDGELITLMYPIDDHVGGPPFKALVADYEAVLCPLGFQPVLIEENELAIGGRKGMEKLGRWKRTSAKPSSL